MVLALAVPTCNTMLTIANDVRVGKINADDIPRIEELSTLKALALGLRNPDGYTAADRLYSALVSAVSKSTLPQTKLAPFASVVDECKNRPPSAACTAALDAVAAISIR